MNVTLQASPGHVLSALAPLPSLVSNNGTKVGIWKSFGVTTQFWIFQPDGAVCLRDQPDLLLTCADYWGTRPFHDGMEVVMWSRPPTGPGRSQRWMVTTEGQLALQAAPNMVLTSQCPDPAGNGPFTDGQPCAIYNRSPTGTAPSQRWILPGVQPQVVMMQPQPQVVVVQPQPVMQPQVVVASGPPIGLMPQGPPQNI